MPSARRFSRRRCLLAVASSMALLVDVARTGASHGRSSLAPFPLVHASQAGTRLSSPSDPPAWRGSRIPFSPLLPQGDEFGLLGGGHGSSPCGWEELTSFSKSSKSFCSLGVSLPHWSNANSCWL